MKAVAIIPMLVAATATAFAAAQQNVPLPRAKPNVLNAQPVQQTAPILQVGEPTSANSPCSKILREIAEFKPLPDSAGPGECGATDRVRLDAVKMPDGSRVKMNPAATLRCPMAEAIAEWVRNDLRQAAEDHGSALRAVSMVTSYDCRPRNGIKGAKISEHGRANAVDLASIRLANGTVDLTRPQASKVFRDKARASACSRFTTVLGPGADAHHEDHIHVDLAARSSGHRMCQWDVRDDTVVASAKPTPAPTPPPARTLGAAKAAPSLLRTVSTAAGAPVPTQVEVPLPLRRPFEMMFAQRSL